MSAACLGSKLWEGLLDCQGIWKNYVSTTVSSLAQNLPPRLYTLYGKGNKYNHYLLHHYGIKMSVDSNSLEPSLLIS